LFRTFSLTEGLPWQQESKKFENAARIYASFVVVNFSKKFMNNNYSAGIAYNFQKNA
jgi:hypothetical protein